MSSPGRLLVLVGVLVLAMVAVGSAPADAVPGDCQNDSKLIGPILLSTDDVEGTWWYLTREGLEKAGYDTEQEQLDKINGWFGTSFSELEDAVVVLVDAVRPADKNGNDYVCASSARGTHANVADPTATDYFFMVIDDKHVRG
jgi:hypothetical protein